MGFPKLPVALAVVSLGEIGAVTAQAEGSLVGYGTVQVLFRSVQIITLTMMHAAAVNSWTSLMTGTLAGYGLYALGRMISFSQSLFLPAAAMAPLGVAAFGCAAGLLPLGVYTGAVIPVVIPAAAFAFQLGRILREPQEFAFEHLAVRGTAVILAMGLANAWETGFSFRSWKSAGLRWRPAPPSAWTHTIC